jgi:hypothetical protein
MRCLPAATAADPTPCCMPLPSCRFCQMMWRLNFLVFFCCVVLDNHYMLYYICPMHTIFTVMVFLALWLGNKYNKSLHWLVFK